MVPHTDVCEETQDHGQQTLTAISALSENPSSTNVYQAISMLFAGEPTYCVFFFHCFWLGILPVAHSINIF